MSWWVSHSSPQGHMVPMDQPAAAFQMITSFTRDVPLVGEEATRPVLLHPTAAEARPKEALGSEEA
jgi:hypothetical protein